MKSSLPLIALAVLLSSNVVGALSAAPIDAPLRDAPQSDAPQSNAPLSGTVAAPPAPLLQLADNDGDGDGGFFGWFGGHGGHHGHHDHDDDDDDDHGGRTCPPGATGCAAAPAAAGTAAPPANGLFTPGTKPQVQTN